MGVGVETAVADRDPAFVGDVPGHPGDELQVVHPLELGAIVAVTVRSRVDFVFNVEKGEEGLTGKITNEAGLIPEIICRNMAFAENELTFDIDLPEGMGTVLNKVSLVLDGDTLKGSWTNPEDGSSDVVEFARKK